MTKTNIYVTTGNRVFHEKLIRYIRENDYGKIFLSSVINIELKGIKSRSTKDKIIADIELMQKESTIKEDNVYR